MPKVRLISENRLIAMLTMLPVPIHVHVEDDDSLYHWNVGLIGEGTAQDLEEALSQALTFMIVTLQEQTSHQAKLLRPAKVSYKIPDGTSPFSSEANPKTWQKDER